MPSGFVVVDGPVVWMRAGFLPQAGLVAVTCSLVPRDMRSATTLFVGFAKRRVLGTIASLLSSHVTVEGRHVGVMVGGLAGLGLSALRLSRQRPSPDRPSPSDPQDQVGPRPPC